MQSLSRVCFILTYFAGKVLGITCMSTGCVGINHLFLFNGIVVNWLKLLFSTYSNSSYQKWYILKNKLNYVGLVFLCFGVIFFWESEYRFFFFFKQYILKVKTTNSLCLWVKFKCSVCYLVTGVCFCLCFNIVPHTY